MSDVKRYDEPVCEEYRHEMDEWEGGEYVRYEDYERLERELATAKKVIENDTENEEALRKLVAKWDQSDSYGMEPLVDIVERMLGELATAKADQRKKDAEIARRGQFNYLEDDYYVGYKDACEIIANAIERGE